MARFGQMQDQSKNRGEMWDKENFKGGMRVKIHRRDPEMLPYEGGIGYRTATCGIVSELQA